MSPLPTPQEICERLQKPLLPQPQNDDGVFRLALVLNGTVSAGAWTAGVLDALIQALDTWEAAKALGEAVPHHKVRVEVLTGASGGSVNAAILARTATMVFPQGNAPGGFTASNPFWRVWVEALTLERMLAAGDLADSNAPAASLLDGSAIDEAVTELLDWGVSPDPHIHPVASPRPWLANPLHAAMTLTNLRGIPFAIDFTAAAGQPRRSWFTAHADHMLFAFPNAPGAAPTRDDVEVVPPDLADPGWERVGRFARASAAFPAGFPPVRLTRPTADYNWRAVMAPAGGGQQPQLRLLEPAWNQFPADQQPGPSYAFDSVDGGALNNQPLELARCGLVGIGNSLERDPLRARAATVLIDPFAAVPDIHAPVKPLDLFGVATGTLGTLIQHARYSTADLLLATDADVASRFLLTPGRTNAANKKVWGSEALTTSEAGAFIGFAFRDYRVHDYFLGRQNCLAWLLKHFGLPADNPVFGGFGGSDAAADYLQADGCLPIIPVVPPLRAIPDQPAWPRVDPDEVGFTDALRARFRRIIQRTGALDGVPCGGPAASLVSSWAGDKAASAIVAAVKRVNQRA